jgi:hypothetical protein
MSTIYENKRICPKQSKFGVDEQSSGMGYHRRTVALTEAYAKLQNIQNYVSLSTTSFRNSCAFGLDTILGKMMSKAEQDIDYEFVKRFELAVAERDEFRSLLLKHMHSVGLGQDTLLKYTTQEDLKDLYDNLVENGIDLDSQRSYSRKKDL